MSTETNHFAPDTPSEDWQQYVCKSCGWKRRVAVAPSEAPMSIYRICKRCESRQRMRADGGSGQLPMIDLTTDTDESPAAILGGLRAGRIVRTPVRDDDESLVDLTGNDGVCSACETQIEPDAFGPDAPLFSLLANQKMRYGETTCPDCHSDLSE